MESTLITTDLATPPLLPSGEPDWSAMAGTHRGRRPTVKELTEEAGLLLEQSMLLQ